MREETRPSHFEPDGDGRPDGKKLSFPPWLAVAVPVVVALIFFVVQNGDEVAFSWLVFDMTGPLWVVIVVAAVAGAILGEAIGFLRRRRQRGRQRNRRKR